MSAYNEPEKNKVRNDSLKYAIKTLTTERSNATLARKSYVREVKDQLLRFGSDADKEAIKYLTDNEIDGWEKFYQSIVGRKRSQDLKVAYLSGPNPLNDLSVLVNEGILPENVWAFESDMSTYTKATIKALDSSFPFIKIFKGKINNYFKILPFRFDIIYLDFCGTIASSDTLTVIRDLFLHQKLNSPGILITNFSLPEKSNDKNDNYWDSLIDVSANYLYPKSFTERLTNYGGGCIESPEVYGISQEQYFKKAHRNPETFYSQFITRILFDIPSVITPFQRFASNENLRKMFFKPFKLEGHLLNEYYEDILTFPDLYPLIWGFENFVNLKTESYRTLQKIIKQIALGANVKKFSETIKDMYYLMSESTEESHYSDTLKKMKKNWNFQDHHIFCDVFLFHQLKDILFGQLTSPYFYNVSKTKRWTYIAKTTRMFTDLITYDECRYVFDWMPTVDMFEQGIYDPNRQLSLRFAVDTLAKNRRWYNDEFFQGTAIIDQNEKGFEAKTLRKRIKIN